MEKLCVLFSLLSFLFVANASLLPTHVYLSLTGDPSQVQVTFTTTTLPKTAQVSFWTGSSNAAIYLNISSTDIIKFNRPVTSVVNYISSVTLKSLKNGVVYSYRIEGAASNVSTRSKVFSFKHIPAKGAPVTLGIYGDLGAYGYALVQTSESGLKSWAATGKFDTIIHNGDLAYNLATSNGAVGDEFMTKIEPITSVVPYICTPGNHEFWTKGEDEMYYKNFWAGQSLLGKNSDSTSGTMWFSFDIGTVHIVGISTEVYCEDTANIVKQHNWLNNDLITASARADKPWIVVLGHRPLYSGQSSYLHSRLMRLGLQCSNDSLTDCDPLTPCKKGLHCGFSIESLLTKYKVDMYIAGHEHLYKRNNPISEKLTFETHATSDKYVNPQSPVYIISGAPGTAHTPSIDYSAGPSPTVVSTTVFSFSSLVAYNNSAIYYEQISAVDGAIIDKFWILKNTDKPVVKNTSFTIDSDTQTICDQ